MQDRSLALTGTPLLFEERVVVAAPADIVYRRWTDFSHFPEFMAQVREIRPVGADRYHWVADVLGAPQEWDAAVTDREINRRVAWRSLNGDHQTMTITLTPLDAEQTELLVRAEYAVPESQADHAVDRLRQQGQSQLREDLERFQRGCSLRRSVPAPRTTGMSPRRIILAVAITAGIGAVSAASVWFMARQLGRRRAA